MTDIPLPFLYPRAPSSEEHRPLQKPGTHEHLHRGMVGGPESSQDIRFIVSVPVLNQLLEAARRSITSRAVVMGAAFKLITYSDRGHIFQVFTLLGREVAPEHPLVIVPLIGILPGSPVESISEPDHLPPGAEGWQKLTERMIGGDLLLILPGSALEEMLERASASPTRRVILHRAGLILDTYRDDSGAPYQIVTVTGISPKPEAQGQGRKDA